MHNMNEYTFQIKDGFGESAGGGQYYMAELHATPLNEEKSIKIFSSPNYADTYAYYKSMEKGLNPNWKNERTI